MCVKRRHGYGALIRLNRSLLKSSQREKRLPRKRLGKILNAEKLTRSDPDVIVLPTANGFHPPREILEGPDFALLSELRAIKNRKVVSMPWTPMNWCPPRGIPARHAGDCQKPPTLSTKDIKVHEFALKFYKDVYKVDDKTAKGLRSTQWLAGL